MKKLFQKIAPATLFTTLLFVSQVAYGDVAVVVNPGFSGSADKEKVSQIYLGKDKSLTPLMSAGPAGDEFVNKVLARNASQYKAYWAKLAFTGGGRPPEELGGDEEVLKKVSASSDAIGFVDAAAVNDSVKVLFTL